MNDKQEEISWELEASKMIVKLERRMTSFSIWVGDDEDINTWIEIRFNIIDHSLLLAEAIFQNGHSLHVVLNEFVVIGQSYGFKIRNSLLKTPMVRRVMKKRNRKSRSGKKPPPIPPGAR